MLSFLMSWGVVEARIFINEIDTNYPLSLILVICLCNGNLISIKNTTNADAFEHAFRCMVLSDDLYLCTHALTNRVKPFSSMHLWSATRIGQNVTNLPNYKRKMETWIRHFSSVVHCGKSYPIKQTWRNRESGPGTSIPGTTEDTWISPDGLGPKPPG